jgi:hypothetical protein
VVVGRYLSSALVSFVSYGMGITYRDFQSKRSYVVSLLSGSTLADAGFSDILLRGGDGMSTSNMESTTADY